MSSFSDMLIYLRKRNKLSQQELADKVGVARSSIGMYETGKREPDFETLEIFADFFNVNMDTLLGKASIAIEKPAPTPENELTDLQKQAIQFVMSLSNDQLRQFIRIGEALIEK